MSNYFRHINFLGRFFLSFLSFFKRAPWRRGDRNWFRSDPIFFRGTSIRIRQPKRSYTITEEKVAKKLRAERLVRKAHQFIIQKKERTLVEYCGPNPIRELTSSSA